MLPLIVVEPEFVIPEPARTAKLFAVPNPIGGAAEAAETKNIEVNIIVATEVMIKNLELKVLFL